MNSRKVKQLRKMTLLKLEEEGTPFISPQDYKKLKFHTIKNDAELKAYKHVYKEAKQRYSSLPNSIKEKVGEEWSEDLE